MYNEEKRELRLQISQLLADAGLNQKTIKDTVEKEITNKVERAIEQVFKHLDSQTSSGSYIGEWVERYLKYSFSLKDEIRKQIKSELSNKIISVEFNDMVKPQEYIRKESDIMSDIMSDIPVYDVCKKYQPDDYVRYNNICCKYKTLQEILRDFSTLMNIRGYIEDAKRNGHSSETIINHLESILGDED